MGGGLIQLVAAKGLEDKYLTLKPDMTYFKMVYRRHQTFRWKMLK